MKLKLVHLVAFYFIYVSGIAQTWDEYYASGVENYNAADYIPAIEDFSKAISLNPLPYIFEARAVSNYKIYRINDAIEDLNKAIKIDTCNWEILCFRSKIKLFQNDFKGAYELVSRALLLAPDDKKTLVLHGITCLRLGKKEAAISDFNALIKKDSLDGETYYFRGLAFHATMRYDKAIKDYSIALRLGYKNSEIYFDRAFTYSKQDMHDQAFADNMDALGLLGNNDSLKILIFDNIGWDLTYLGKLDSAKIFFNRSLSIDSGYVDPLVGLAFVNFLQDDFVNSREALNLAIKSLPTLAKCSDPIQVLEKQGYFYKEKSKHDMLDMFARFNIPKGHSPPGKSVKK